MKLIDEFNSDYSILGEGRLGETMFTDWVCIYIIYIICLF